MSIPYGPILVVEDVAHILELLEVTLRFKGYPVVTARNGQEALDFIAQEHPALVITDILMPKLDGFALVHRLRSNPKTSGIPIVFLSATYVTPEEFLLTVAEVLTQGPATMPRALDDQQFYRGYRDRLENKLRHKIGQIQRTERLLETLPEDQKPAFRALLEEAFAHRDEIKLELDELYRLLEQFTPEKP